ncbi:hypothetical protein ACFX13_031169 [Malus domestica]
MHKISEDFGTTESVKFITFARLLRSLVWINVASSLEVLFLYPGVISLTNDDAQGLFLNWAGGFSGFLQSIKPTQEFEGQNKSIKSRVRSTLMIWDTFAIDKVVDVSTRVLLRLSPHASLYPSHLPYLFLRQMWYLLWKHKMLKMSTREQCPVRPRPKEKTRKKHDMGYSCF